MTKFERKKITVIGAARSGLAAALALQSQGAEVFLTELGPAEKFAGAVGELSKSNIGHEFGGHSEKAYDCELVVTSPGVPADSQVLKDALARGIKVVSELELGFQLCRGRVLAITGSNGKTTTTALVGEIFKHAMIPSEVAGNIGKPFSGVAKSIPENGWAILEVSTFQLEWIDEFRPNVAVILNITPDHLDRHKSMAAYAALKFRILANQNGKDKVVLNLDDDYLKSARVASQIFGFSVRQRTDRGCFVREGKIYLRSSGKEELLIQVDKIGIKGPHNLSNACAAAACCAAAGIDTKAIAEGLRTFAGVPHRLEKVGLIGGVSFINDSKATNVDAVYWALQSVASPIVLIAGGRDKGGHFETLGDLVRRHVKHVLLIGEAAGKIAAAFDGLTEIHTARSMFEAVEEAYGLAEPGATVLLSPGCASFDMFDNFEHRGDVFKEAVNKLQEGHQ